MKVEVKVEVHDEYEKKDYLHAKLTGEFSLERAKETFLEVLEAVAANQSTRVLFDGREITGSLNVSERFYYSVFVAEETIRLVKNAPRFAYVLREPVKDPRRFCETVALNRGMVVRSFERFDEALEWLTSANKAKNGGCNLVPTNRTYSG